MNSSIRAGVLLLAGLTTTSAVALAAPGSTGQAGLPEAESSEFTSLAALVATAPRSDAPKRLARTTLQRQVQSLAASAVAAETNRPHFPIRAEFNWGQGGARFGASRGGRSHAGQDVFARTGAPLVAIRDGIVVEEGDGGGRGNYVALYDPVAGATHVYLHMNRRARVRTGQRVAGGQRVGEVGCTGSCFGDHLHFEVRRGRGADGSPIDPFPLLRRWAAASRASATLPAGQH